MRERSFAPGVDRDEIRGCEESIGIGVDELLQLGIEGLGLVAAEVGLTAALEQS